MKSLAAIHVGLKQLGINDEDKRGLYSRVTGKARLTEMSPAEQEKVLTELRRLGFKADLKRPNGRRKFTGRFAKKMQALWIGAWNLGLVKLKDDAALEAFITRQTGLSSERFLHNAEDARKVVEALKSWMTREVGIQWDKTQVDWLALDGARIAWAQWKILHPGADLISRKGFDQAALALAGRNDWLAAITAAEWVPVMNELGQRVRQERKAAAA